MSHRQIKRLINKHFKSDKVVSQNVVGHYILLDRLL